MLCLLASCSSTQDEGRLDSLLAVQESAETTLESTRMAYEEAPTDRRALYNYAYLLLHEGQGEEALEVIREAQALYAPSLRFSYLEAAAYYSLGRHQSYLATYGDILSWDPANVDVLATLAEYEHFHFHEEAARSYAERALDYAPTDSRALSVMALYEPYFASLATPLSDRQAPERRKAPSLPSTHFPIDVETLSAELSTR